MILKHFDFQVPSWGEFAAGPIDDGAGAGTTLSQDAAASFPDRPTTGGVGLLCTLATGTGGEYLRYDSGAAQLAPTYARVMLAPNTATNGNADFLSGRTDLDAELWTVTLSPVLPDPQVTLTVNATAGTAIALDSAVPWHCIEVKIGSTSSELWINGVLADTVAHAAVAGTQVLWVGGFNKASIATGAVWLDEVIMSGSYIGPVIVQPNATDLSDPRRWLVLYNTDEADSITWANWYRGQHSIPYANLCGLALGATEAISNASWVPMRDAIEAYITNNALPVSGILLGHRCPGTVNGSPNRSVVSLLMDLNDDTADKANPLYESGVIDVGGLPARTSLVGASVYAVAEITAPTLAEAKDLTTLANALKTLDANSRVLSALDPPTDKIATQAAAWTSLTSWLANVLAQAPRLPAAAGYDGTDHGNSIEFTDAVAGTFNTAGQTKALLVSIGNDTANTIRS